MLGYVKTDAQELRLREYTYYRALYCGLCKRMGKCTGSCSRMTLSYDFVFLAAVRLSVTGETPRIQNQRCLLHPLRSHPTVQKCDALDYAANASALLCYRKLFDDIQDEHGFKKLGAYLVRPFLFPAYKKAKKRYPRLNDAIGNYLKTLSQYENGDIAFDGAEAPGALFGELMKAVFCEGLNEHEARLAGTVGAAIGHWIYLVDAADDFEEDCKQNRFNPYRRAFGTEPQKKDWENLRLALTAQLCEAERAFLLIDAYPAAELQKILENILYLGLPKTADRVIEKALDKTEDNQKRAVPKPKA